jgi:hypothetical protein
MFVEEFLKVHPNARWALVAICISILMVIFAHHLKNYLKDRECEKQLSEINDMIEKHRKEKTKREENSYEELLKEYELEFNF